MKKTKQLLILLMCSAMAVFSGCSKDDDDNNNNPGPTPTPTPVTVNSEPQVAFKLDGTSLNYVTGGINPYSSYFGNSSLMNTWPDSSETTYGFGFENILTGNYVMEFHKGTFKHMIPSDSADFTDFFPKQTIPYSIDAEDGIMIRFYDGTGTLWSTDQGSANQTGSVFKIDDRKPFLFASEKYIKVKFSFNCKVYDGSGASKTITNGVGVITFWADN